jgi:hypothetical protein
MPNPATRKENSTENKEHNHTRGFGNTGREQKPLHNAKRDEVYSYTATFESPSPHPLDMISRESLVVQRVTPGREDAKVDERIRKFLR